MKKALLFATFFINTTIYSCENRHQSASHHTALHGQMGTLMDTFGMTPARYLIAAARHGDIQMMQFYLNLYKQHINDRDKAGYSALYRTLASGHITIADLLLQHGARTENLHFSDKKFTPVHFLVVTEESAARLKAVLDWHAEKEYNFLNINQQDTDGITPLMYVITKKQTGGHKEFVEALLARNANVYLRDRFGNDALFYACFEHTSCALLIAQRWEINDRRETAIHRVVEAGNVFTLKKILDTLSVDLEAKDRRGNTPLLIALKRRNQEVAIALLKHGVQTGYIMNNWAPHTPIGRLLNSLLKNIATEQAHLDRLLDKLLDDALSTLQAEQSEHIRLENMYEELLREL